MILKTIKVQIGYDCSKCRFNGERNGARYCLAYLKALCIDELGNCIPVNDCYEIKEEKK